MLPTLSSEPHSAKASLLVPRVDPTSVPLSPHSPPISALLHSIKLSLLRMPVSLNGNQSADNLPPFKCCSIEWINQPNLFFLQAEIKWDCSYSRERSPCDLVYQTKAIQNKRNLRDSSGLRQRPTTRFVIKVHSFLCRGMRECISTDHRPGNHELLFFGNQHVSGNDQESARERNQ